LFYCISHDASVAWAILVECGTLVWPVCDVEKEWVGPRRLGLCEDGQTSMLGGLLRPLSVFKQNKC
jgi:hypothetical protein